MSTDVLIAPTLPENYFFEVVPNNTGYATYAPFIVRLYKRGKKARTMFGKAKIVEIDWSFADDAKEIQVKMERLKKDHVPKELVMAPDQLSMLGQYPPKKYIGGGFPAVWPSL